MRRAVRWTDFGNNILKIFAVKSFKLQNSCLILTADRCWDLLTLTSFLFLSNVVSSPLVDLPRSDPFSSGDNHRTLLPHVGDYLQDQASKYHGMKQPAASANTFLVSEQWGHGVQGDRQQMKRRSFETSVVHEHPLDQSSESINQESVSEHRPSLPPAARLFPLKNRYYMYQNAFSANSEILPNGDAVPGHRQNAVVKPNSVTQPPIAVATPYDGKPSAEDESLSTGGGVPENINRKLLKKCMFRFL